MQNIAIIKQGTGRYLFSVPDNVTLKEGDRVKCDTKRGITDGIAFADSAWVDENVSQLIGKLTGAKFPLKSVVGKTVTSVEMFEQPEQPKQEPVKLYCVKESNVPWVRDSLTKGKVYEFDGHFIEYDSGTSTRFNNFESWKRGDPNYAACLVPLVKRPAKVGEWVYTTQTNPGLYSQGKIARVTWDDNVLDHTVRIEGSNVHSGGCWIHEYNYLVLDGYHPEPEKEPEPEYWNGKVVCVEEDGFFTVGKVYEFRDGIIRSNTGNAYNAEEPIKSLDDLNDGTWKPKFIEFKGEAND